MSDIERLSHRSLTYLLFIATLWASVSSGAQQDVELVSADAAALFGSRCAHCHGSGVIQPDVKGLSKLTAKEIYHTLWNGIMREAANGLDDAQRRAIATYVAGLNPDKPSDKVSGYCQQDMVKNTLTGAWTGWAPAPHNSRFVGDLNMSKAELQKARLKWSFVFPDTGATTNAGNQPTVAGGRLFIGHRNKYVYSLDAKTGCIHWTFKAATGVRSAIVIVDKLALFGDYENNVYAVSADTGSLIWRERADQQPSARINGNLIVHDGIAYVPISSNQEFVNALDPLLPCCSFRGSIVAYEVKTGRRIWKTNTIDQPLQKLGKSNRGVMQYGPSGGAVWSIATVDAKRNLLYVGTSNQYTGPVVQESDAVIAFDLKTGEKKWVQNFAPERTGGVDVWNGGCVGVLGDPAEECPEDNVSGVGDWDLGSPVVLQTREDGRDIMLVGSKEGMLFALDPDKNGARIWGRRVGKVMSVKGPSFGGIEHGISADGKRAYVPIADIDVIEGMFFQTSGYGQGLGMPGHVLYAFEIPEE